MTRIKRCWRPQGRFLREFARTGSISGACRAAGLARRTAYRWRDADADFHACWENAREGAVERLRDELMERGLVGTERPVWRDGWIAGHETVVDTRVLWKLLQAVQAETHGLRTVELQAKRERGTELARRLDAVDKRLAVYEAEIRAQAARNGKKSHDAE